MLFRRVKWRFLRNGRLKGRKGWSMAALPGVSSIRKAGREIRRRVPALLAVLGLLACSAGPALSAGAPLVVTIAHINDTHSRIDAVNERLSLAGQPVVASFGGMARLKTAVDELRRKEPNVMLLHAGDAVQGTLYFHHFQGGAEMEMLNRLGVDVMTLGNHEFDKGPSLVNRLLAQARFPVVCANVDVSREPAVDHAVPTHWIARYGAERVAIVGVTTETTAIISSPGKNIRFLDAFQSVRRVIRRLRSDGVNKIVVLSHIGYKADKRLARAVAGIDVIVGGHSHSLLGDADSLSRLGLQPEGPYPTIVRGPGGKKVLVVQAWRWTAVLGMIQVRFDGDGEIEDYRAAPFLVAGDVHRLEGRALGEGPERDAVRRAIESTGAVRWVGEDPAVRDQRDRYAVQIDRIRGEHVAVAAEDLRVGLNTGPGPLMADAMCRKTGAAVAILNRGGVRKDIPAGDITLGTVYEVFPFGSTLVLLDLTGDEIHRALEDIVDFALHRGGHTAELQLPYVAGLSYALRTAEKKGRRVVSLQATFPAGSPRPLEPAKTYRIVTSSFLAGGGDGMDTLRSAAGYRYDTGFVDADVFAEFLRGRERVSDPREDRIRMERVSGMFRPCLETPPCRGERPFPLEAADSRAATG